MKKELRKGLRTWIEIDKKAIKNNFNVFKKLIPKSCKFLAVVKSNAYGHNLIEFSKEMERLGVDFLGVDSITEALALRKENIKIPILVLGYTLPERIDDAIRNNISIAVSSFETISAIKKYFLLSCEERGSHKAMRDKKNILNIHIKVDTGMNRHGFQFSDHERLMGELKKITKISNIKIEGLFTHFSSAKNPKDMEYTKKQNEIFKKWIESFKSVGYNPITHACATSGTIIFPEAHFDMVRIGIGLYGEPASREISDFNIKNINLKPIMSWKTIIAEIKKVPAGEKVGYDGTNILQKNTTIAVCPIGYWHGYPRLLSNKGFVLIKGNKAKILGRVCMDIIMIDITNIEKVKVGDEVVVIGKSGKERVSASDISSIIECSNYELLTRINPLIKKYFI